MIMFAKIDNGWRQVAHFSLQLLAESGAKCRGTSGTTDVMNSEMLMVSAW